MNTEASPSRWQADAPWRPGGRPRPGHAGDRPGGVPRRARRRGRSGRGAPPRRRGGGHRDPWPPTSTHGRARRARRAVAVLRRTRCVVVRGLEDLPEESVDGLLDYAAAPGRGRRAGAGARRRPEGQRPAHQAAQAGGGHRGEVGRAEGRRSSRASSPPRCAAHGGRIDQDAADFLVQAVGQDLRSLAAAASQLANDFPGQPLTVDEVKQYFGGRAEAKSFAVADAAFWGRPRSRARGAALGARRAGPRRCWSPARSPAAPAAWPSYMAAPRGHARGRPGPRGRRARRGSCAPSATSPAAGPTPGSPARSGRSRRPTPTSRARPATRRTRWSGWCSTVADRAARPRRRYALHGLRQTRLQSSTSRARGQLAHRPERTGATRPSHGARSCCGLKRRRRPRLARPDGSTWLRRGALRERRPSWRSPTCGSRPGSCG